MAYICVIVWYKIADNEFESDGWSKTSSVVVLLRFPSPKNGWREKKEEGKPKQRQEETEDGGRTHHHYLLLGTYYYRISYLALTQNIHNTE
jgi:hypothetical protein